MNLKSGKELLKFAAIGARAAVKRVLRSEDAERFLVTTLSAMPGAPAKMGQLLGMRDASQIPRPDPMPLEDVKTIIQLESPRLASEIESLSERSVTASIGQTHQAYLKSGERIAIKIQYPDVAASLAAQIDAFFSVAAFSPAKKYEFDIQGTKAFVRQAILSETDYQLEATSQKIFHKRYMGSNIIVPSVYSEYSTAKILVQSWEESFPLADVKVGFDSDQRKQASTEFTRFLLDSILGLGTIHTDLHPGNYGFRVVDGVAQLVLYDFGSTHALNRDIGSNIFEWLEATKKADIPKIMQSLVQIGFSENLLRPIQSSLVSLSEVLLAPILSKEIWHPSKWDLASKIDEILGQNKWWFRTAGPSWFMYFMRTIHGWHYALCELDVPVNVQAQWMVWEQPLRAISDFVKRDALINRVNLEAVNQSENSSLRVMVTECGESIIDMTFPVAAVENLENLLPDSVLKKCEVDGIDISKIKRDALESNMKAQELFFTEISNRQCRVWLD